MLMTKSKEVRIVLYNKLYTAVSRATAETRDRNGKVVKTVFKGFVKDLFKDVHTLTVTKFLWAVSHKTPVLGTPLFRVTYHGKKGYEIERLHSGFVCNETGKKITGLDLVPYIIEAAKLYQTNPRTAKEAPAVEVQKATVVPEQPVAVSYAGKPVKPEQLTDEEIELSIREYRLSLDLLEQEKTKRDSVKAKKAELLKVFNEMAKKEGFDLEDIIGII